MKLLTREIENAFVASERKYGADDGATSIDRPVICKFFNPCGMATWFATEMTFVVNAKDADGDWGETEKSPATHPELHWDSPEVHDVLFFGWAIMLPGCGEHGTFSLNELKSVRLPFGLGIERDRHFGTTTPLSKAIEPYDH